MLALMISGGKGGANTKTGLHFEHRTDLLKRLGEVPGYTIKSGKIYFNKELVGVSLQKNRLYRFLEERGVDYNSIVSKKLLPDEAIFIPKLEKLFIVEMKFQKIAGSVDEKLQTCDFKRKQYQKMFSPLGIEVEYYYVLSDWFLHKSYNDVLAYIESVGCRYFIEDLPLREVGLQ